MSTYTDWPKKGDEREQPWQNPEEAGIRPRAGLPLLASGSADPGAHEIFAALDKLGYESPISRGENPVGVIGPEELAAVRQFRNDYGVQEDPSAFGGDNPVARNTAEGFIGPWTAEAILRAADQENGDQADTGAPAESEDVVAQLRTQLSELEGRVSALESATPETSEPEPAQAPASAPPSEQTPPPEPTPATAPTTPASEPTPPSPSPPTQ